MSHMNDAATMVADAIVTTKRSGFMDSSAACNEHDRKLSLRYNSNDHRLDVGEPKSSEGLHRKK